MYVLAPFNTVVTFCMTLLSRKFEYQADAFAKELGFASELKKSLIKLNVDNLGFPIYDNLYSSWNHSVRIFLFPMFMNLIFKCLASHIAAANESFE